VNFDRGHFFSLIKKIGRRHPDRVSVNKPHRFRKMLSQIRKNFLVFLREWNRVVDVAISRILGNGGVLNKLILGEGTLHL